MITITEFNDHGHNAIVGLMALSTDALPIDEYNLCPLINGTYVYLIDTGDVMMYDAEHKTWEEA